MGNAKQNLLNKLTEKIIGRKAEKPPKMKLFIVKTIRKNIKKSL